MPNGMNNDGRQVAAKKSALKMGSQSARGVAACASVLWASPLVFGLLMAACIPFLAHPLARGLSPFAGTVIAFASGTLLLVPACLSSYLKDSRPTARLLARASLTGTLLLLATSFFIIGVGRGADPLAATLFLSLLPSFSLLGRKVLWGESLGAAQKAGLLLSILAAAFWLTFAKSSRPLEGFFVPASRDASFLGDALVFVGSLLLGFAFAAGRPSELRVSVSTWWFLVVSFGFVASLPLMYGAHVFVNGLDSPFSGMSAATLRSEPTLLLPFAFFGIAHLFFRMRLLGRSGVQLSVGTTSLASSGALLLAGTFFAGLLGLATPLAHFVMLPLHLFGLCLCRNALVPSVPYVGLREVVPRKATELRVAK